MAEEKSIFEQIEIKTCTCQKRSPPAKHPIFFKQNISFNQPLLLPYKYLKTFIHPVPTT